MGGGGGIGGAINNAVGSVGNVISQPLNPQKWVDTHRAAAGVNVAAFDPLGITGLAGAVGGFGPGKDGGGGGFSNPFARPDAPTFESQIDPATGLLKQQYQQKSQLNEQGLEAMRAEALRDPSKMSKWREIAQTQGMDQLGRNQAAQLAQAQSGLASAGGLSQGARERLQQQSMQQGLLGGQNMWTQLAAQDEQKRAGMLAGLPGQEMAAAQYKSGIGGGNIEAALREIDKKRAFDMNRYNQEMQAWGAGQTAAAMPVPQNKGFFGNMFEGIF